MDAIRLTGKAANGMLSIKVPKEFEDEELEIIILSTKEKIGEEITHNKSGTKEKTDRLMEIIATAKYPNFPITKHDVYNQ